MARPKISAATEAELLLKCRRRCCMCYGLDRDLRIVQGQIAHLDRIPSHNDVDNLAFLCFAHHDQYDSRTSQSKNFTIVEVKAFKQELEAYVHTAWSRHSFGVDDITSDVFSGKYISGNDFAGAYLTIKYVGGGFIEVSGIALYGKNREFGPNIGDIDFQAKLEGNKVVYTAPYRDREYRLELTFLGHRLVATEDMAMGYFGFGASFEGTYHRQL